MGLNFRKSIKIAPGIKLNIGKKSAGVSLGGKYGGVSFNSRTGARARVSAPGTGLSYTTKIGGGKTSNNAVSNKNSSQKTGSCLTTCLKGIGFIMLLPFGWLYGIYWLVAKRKKLENEPTQQKKETAKVGILSALSFLMFLIATCGSDNSSGTLPVSTEVNTEYISSEYTDSTEFFNTELIDIETTEFSTESATEEPIVSDDSVILEDSESYIDAPVPESEVQSESSEPESSITEPVTPEPESEPVANQTTAPEPEATLVWISENGQKYHSRSSCSNMKSPYQVTIEQAETMDKTPCGRCY